MANKKLFIGSSSEALSVAYYIKSVIENPANNLANIQVDVWKDTDWQNLELALTSINDNIDEYYYAIFIGFPDSELIETRSGVTKNYYATRDNTLFEFGLFFSRFGKERTFFLLPKDIPGYPEFKILTDVGRSAYVQYYDIELTAGGWALKKFDDTELIRLIAKEETRLMNVSIDPNNELDRQTKLIGSQLQVNGKNNEYYINKLKHGIGNLVYAKTHATGINIKELAIDTLVAIKDVNDFCKPIQLADKQKYVNGIRKVWVFAGKPFEFITPSPTQDYIKKLQDTVRDNLSKGVKYTYFVSHQEFNIVEIDTLVPRTSPLRNNLEIIFIDPKYFKTFFTIHFLDNDQLDSVYMTSLLPHRNDLMIQISDAGHIKRIKERIEKLKGEFSSSNNVNVTDYCIR